MILKHRDRELLRFDWVKPFGVCNVELNAGETQYLPIDFRDRAANGVTRDLVWGLEDWLLHRTAPMNRHGIRAMLRTLGFLPDDPRYLRQLIEFCHGLSLNDVHWVVKDDSRETWADSNLYANDFSTAIASMAFSGDRAHTIRDADTSPEFTTNGNLAKCWRRVDGEIFLYKAGDSCEPYSEFYAAQIAAAMQLDHVGYSLAQFKRRVCSVCPLFTSEKHGFIPAARLMDKAKALSDTRFAEVFFFDAIVFNTDRHLNNFGFLVDNDSNEIVGPAPIFDNGYSLFSQATFHPGHRDDEFCDLRKFLGRKGPVLPDHWLAIPGGITDSMLARLDRLRDFRFELDHAHNLPPERLKAIQYFLRKRIDEVLRFGEKADDLLNIKAKRDTIGPVNSTSSELPLDEQILGSIRLFPFVTRTRLAEMCGVSAATIARQLKALQSAGKLRRIGARKNGQWEVCNG